MTKTELRKAFTDKRQSLSPKALETISEGICHTLFSNFQFENKTISLFLPIERKKEVNTYLIWEKARDFGAKVAVPKINESTGDLKHILFESYDQLEVSSFGIPEPIKGRVVAAEHFDIVLVPLLAIDSRGNRVGYGKGYYDRFLAKCSPRTIFIGISHFDPISKQVEDINAMDVKLNCCITPDSIHRF